MAKRGITVPDHDHETFDHHCQHGHDGGAAHAHSHSALGHSHAPASFGRAFAIGVALNFAIVLLQVVYGVIAHSLALLSDAGHNLGDVLGLLLAWSASYLATHRPTERRTYGLRSFSILAAMLNAIILLVVTGAIAWEAIRRFAHPEPVAGTTVMWVAALAIVFNGATALLFMAGREHDLNIRGAFMHMAADAAVAAGVLLAGLLVHLTGWAWVDPLTSLLISVVIVAGTWSLLRDSVNLALDAVPEGIDLNAVRQYLQGLPEVTEVHDLHVWAMSTTETALTAHLVRTVPTCDDALVASACTELHDRFGIQHVTVQFETANSAHPCRQAPEHVV